MNQIPALIRVFSYLSILTVGGGMAAFPEMKILTVDVHKWLTFQQLIHLYSVGQMAPGPNMMMIVAISGVSCGHFQFLYLHRLGIMFPQVKGGIPVRSWRLDPQLSRVCAQAGAGFAHVIHRCVHKEIAVRWPGQ